MWGPWIASFPGAQARPETNKRPRKGDGFQSEVIGEGGPRATEGSTGVCRRDSLTMTNGPIEAQWQPWQGSRREQLRTMIGCCHFWIPRPWMPLVCAIVSGLSWSRNACVWDHFVAPAKVAGWVERVCWRNFRKFLPANSFERVCLMNFESFFWQTRWLSR